MADIKINEKLVVSQTGTAEPVLASNVTIAFPGKLFASMQVFLETGTWTKPADVTAVYVIVTGAGGGGTAAGGGDRGGAGGGAGGTSIKWITSGLGATETATVGPTTTDGADGTVSSFGSHCTGNGGLAGPANNRGGEGGDASGGNINTKGGGGDGGGNGGQGTVIQLLGSGVGGASYWGGGARALSMGAGQDGEDGNAIGSGGGGSGSNGAASKGHSGIVVVYEYKG